MSKHGSRSPVSHLVVPRIYIHPGEVDPRLASRLRHRPWGATRRTSGFQVGLPLRWVTHPVRRVQAKRHHRKYPQQPLSISLGSGPKDKTLPLLLPLPLALRRVPKPPNNHVHACRLTVSPRHVHRTSHQPHYPSRPSRPNTRSRNGILIANNTRSQIRPPLSPSPAGQQRLYQIKPSLPNRWCAPPSLRPLCAESGRNPRLRLRRGQIITTRVDFARHLRAH